MPLNGNEMQALASRGIRPPRGAGCHEIESQAKPGFDDGEYARAGPAVRQIVAVKKNVSRLIRARLGAVIQMPELFRERRAWRIEGERRRGGYDGHTPSRRAARDARMARWRCPVMTPPRPG